MSFHENLFGSKENHSLEIKKSVITTPSIWSKDLEDQVKDLSQQEKQFLLAICDLLQESIDWHCQYLIGAESMEGRFANDADLRVKSCFELTVLNWTLITNLFAQHSVPAKVGQMLYFVISRSFADYSEIFKSTEFKTFAAAFNQREKVYAKLLNMYFYPRVNEVEAYQNIVEILIGNPLSEDITDGEVMMGSFSYGLESIKKMPVVIEFNWHFSQGMQKLFKKLNDLFL